MTTIEGKHTYTQKNFRSKTNYYSGKLTYDLISRKKLLPWKIKQWPDKKNLLKNRIILSENSKVFEECRKTHKIIIIRP
jgi:hypothetical protein